MDKKENRSLEFKLKSFSLSNSIFSNFLELKKNIQSNFIKQNEDIKTILNNKIRNNKTTKVSKFKCNKRQNNIFLKKVENLFLIYWINVILLNIGRILCESYIIVKINKSGKYKILFNGGVEDVNSPCHYASMHIPNSMEINGNIIDPSINEYQFTEQQNTIK